MGETMSADAVAVFRPRDPAKLRPFLDLDDESEESEGLYAEALDDGAMLVHTFQPFEVFAQNPSEAEEWLAQFGDALPDVHDDPRGLLFFPDTCEPESTTYDAVVEEVGDDGVWIATSASTGELEEDAEPWPIGGLPPIDMQSLQAFAGQLLGGAEGEGASATSFEVAKLFEGLQQELLQALGTPPMHGEANPAVSPEDDEQAARPDRSSDDDDSSDPQDPRR